VRSTFGFGDALLGMPLLALVIPLTTATPLMAFTGPTLSLFLLAREWRHIDWKGVRILIFSTIAGIPLGLLILKRVDARLVTLILAAVIILFALYGFFRPHLSRLQSGRSAVIFGFFGGVLGAAYNTQAPPIVIYGALRGWPPEMFRATLQGYFLPTGLAILVGQGAAGLWTAEVLKIFLWSIPVLAGAAGIGRFFSRRIPPGKFNRWVYGLLFVSGAVLAIKVIF
jgi:uncharacterized membrane protein YfcA